MSSASRLQASALLTKTKHPTQGQCQLAAERLTEQGDQKSVPTTLAPVATKQTKIYA
jgi:hypothetical protein